MSVSVALPQDRIEKAIIWCDRVMAFAMIALVYFVSISIAFVESFFFLALVSHFLKRGLMFSLKLRTSSSKTPHRSFFQLVVLFLRTFKPVDSPLTRPMAAFIFSGFVSIFFSHYPELSLRGFFFKLLEWVYIYFILIEAISSKKRMKILISVLFVSSLLVGIDGLFQHLTGKDFMFGRASFAERVSASFRHPNDFGGYLVVACSFAFSFLWFFPGGSRLPWGSLGSVPKQNEKLVQGMRLVILALFVLLFYNLGMTYSRGAWGAFFLALVYMGLLRGRMIVVPMVLIFLFMSYFSPRMEQKRKVSFITDDTAFATKEAAANALALANVSTDDLQSKDKIADTRSEDYVRAVLEPLKHFTGSGRSVFWENSIPIIRQSPIFGNGVNTYSQMAKGRSGYPHNCYLQLTAEMGVLGLIVLGWMIVVLYQHAIAGVAWVKDPMLLFVLPGASAGLLGFLVHSFVDTNFYSVQLGNLMWLTMGIMMACLKLEKESSSTQSV